MLSAEERTTLRSKLEEYEGNIDHMYLDSNGYVTVGVGHLLSNVANAQKLAFVNAENEQAGAEEIEEDYGSVKAQPANRLASFYKGHTKLILPDAEIDALTDKHIDSFEKELNIIYEGFDQFPSDAKLALFDLIFNLGMTNLKNKWPNFNRAVKERDWQKAAENSSRRAPVSAARNQYVKDLLEKAAKA